MTLRRVIFAAGCVIALIVLWFCMIGPNPTGAPSQPAPAPTTPEPTPATTGPPVNLPDVDAPAGDDDGESRFCRKRRWC